MEEASIYLYRKDCYSLSITCVCVLSVENAQVRQRDQAAHLLSSPAIWELRLIPRYTKQYTYLMTNFHSFFGSMVYRCSISLLCHTQDMIHYIHISYLPHPLVLCTSVVVRPRLYGPAAYKVCTVNSQLCS